MPQSFAPKSTKARLALSLAKLASAPASKANPGRGVVLVDENDQTLTVFVQVEGVDVIVGRDELFRFSLSSRLTTDLVKWLIWWIVAYSWFGLREFLWRKSVAVLYDEELNRAENGSSKA